MRAYRYQSNNHIVDELMGFAPHFYPASLALDTKDGLGIQSYDKALIARAFLLAKATQARQRIETELSMHGVEIMRLKETSKSPDDLALFLREIDHEH